MARIIVGEAVEMTEGQIEAMEAAPQFPEFIDVLNSKEVPVVAGKKPAKQTVKQLTGMMEAQRVQIGLLEKQVALLKEMVRTASITDPKTFEVKVVEFPLVSSPENGLVNELGKYITEQFVSRVKERPLYPMERTKLLKLSQRVNDLWFKENKLTREERDMVKALISAVGEQHERMEDIETCRQKMIKQSS